MRLWGFTEGDTVLSLGLPADEPASIVDTLEAPLAAGARVTIPELGHAAEGEVWDMWAALLAEEEATVLFVASEWCQKLLLAHTKLAGSVRAELATRWAKRPFRHTVAIAPRGTALSVDLSDRWAKAFGCPLTWHFSCAEAGALLTVRSSAEGPEAWAHEGRCAEGLTWRVEDDELWVSGDSLFERYHGRPRSTEEAFRAEDGFCRTFHRVAAGSGPDGLLPLPALAEVELEKLTDSAMYKGPETRIGPGMMPTWKVKKVPIRVYDTWRTAWGGLDVTKKTTTVHKLYLPKYKKRRKL